LRTVLKGFQSLKLIESINKSLKKIFLTLNNFSKFVYEK
jgi:hypothetical protein